VVVACEYSSTSIKADDAIVVRPGTTPALSLGLCHVIMRDKLYDADYVRRFTDLPLLVRADNLKLLRAEEVFGTQPAALKNQTKTVSKTDKVPPPGAQTDILIPDTLRQAWAISSGGIKAVKPEAITRDHVGKFSCADPLLEGAVEVTLKDGKKITCPRSSM
jgi:nitrate reductase alpha subunit